MAKEGWGGSRPGNPNKKRGGARAGAGRMVKWIHLDDVAAAELRTLVMNRRAVTGNQQLSEETFVTELISKAYAEHTTTQQSDSE